MKKSGGLLLMARTINNNIKNVAKQVSSKKRTKIDTKYELVSSSSTLMNLACSDTATGAFRTGRLVNIIGDSSSGKTLVCLGVLAEACLNPIFKKYRLVFDDVENAQSFDLGYLFGSELANRAEPPRLDKNGMPQPSETVEDFHHNVLNLIDDGRPFIYIADSFDAMDADQDREKVEEQREAKERGVKAKGSYGMAKPKKASELFRNICSPLHKSEAIVIVISQVRADIDPRTFTTKNRSGGKALKFYATHEIWMAMAGKIKSKDRVIGNRVRIKISKNKLTGREREVEFTIYYDYGVDDIRSCIEFLVKEKVWKKKGNTVDATGLNIKGTVATLIKKIETGNLEKKLVQITEKAWHGIEDSLKLNRKKRYK